MWLPSFYAKGTLCCTPSLNAMSSKVMVLCLFLSQAFALCWELTWPVCCLWIPCVYIQKLTIHTEDDFRTASLPKWHSARALPSASTFDCFCMLLSNPSQSLKRVILGKHGGSGPCPDPKPPWAPTSSSVEIFCDGLDQGFGHRRERSQKSEREHQGGAETMATCLYPNSKATCDLKI